MYISDLAINNFRSYDEEIFSFSKKTNILIGANGKGKTNLVEAIEYLATFSSHRTANTLSLVKQGEDAAVIRAKVVRGKAPTMAEVEILYGKANRARINRGKVKNNEILGLVKTVVFSPEDLALIKGDPAVRRTFLDSLIIQISPKMSVVKSEYEKVLKQRAAALKNAGKQLRLGKIVDEEIINLWDQQLIALGAKIISQRISLIQQLRPYLEKYYFAVSESEKIARIDYITNIEKNKGWELPSPEKSTDKQIKKEIEKHENKLKDKEYIQTLLKETIKNKKNQEIEKGINLVGPHRDDMRLLLATFPAKGFASHGETWSFALALRLATWELMRDKGMEFGYDYEEPILILDDVFAELDSSRRKKVAKILLSAQQVFITVATETDLPKSIKGKKIFIEKIKENNE